MVWSGDAGQRQDRVLATLVTVGLTGILLMLWLVLFSRLPWRTRGAVVGSLVVAGALFTALFRIEGFSGDVMPIISWRFGGGDALVDASGTASAPTEVSPTDFPQFLGQERNAVVRGVALARDWQTAPPTELWRRAVGEAWSGFAVVGDAVLTQEKRGDEEVVARYDLTTGEPVWTTSYPGFFDTMLGGSGPRATPTVGGGKVYTFGSTGVLSSLDLASGEVLWQHAVADDHQGPLPEWGFAGSPLLVDDLVVVAPGGPDGHSVVAYRQADGELVWSAGDDPASYASPMLTTLGGVRQVVSRNIGSVTGHDPVDGRVLWTAPWPGMQPNVAQPLPMGDDRLLISSGYGIGATLFEFVQEADGTWTVTEVWHSMRMKAKFTNPVLYGGHLYGLDDGVLACVDPATGERQWKRGRYGHGQLLLVDDLLLIQSEKGELVLVEPNPEEHRELTTFPALDGKSWNTLALSGKHLLVRNASEAVAYELPLV